MPEQGFNGKQVNPILIKVGAEGMAEGMAGNPLRPSKGTLHIMDMPGQIKGVDRLIVSGLLWKKPVHGFAKLEPVGGQDVQGSFGKNGITVGAILGMDNVDAHIFTLNVPILQMADFTYAEPG